MIAMLVVSNQTLQKDKDEPSCLLHALLPSEIVCAGGFCF
jgi:hypothetical protein